MAGLVFLPPGLPGLRLPGAGEEAEAPEEKHPPIS